MDLVIIIITSWLAGVAAFVGGVLASFEGSAETETKREIIHGVVAFGGGILLAAVVFSPSNYKIITAGIMSFASGGILYLIFQDIVPQGKLECHWSPPLGAVLGFSFGMLGEQLLR